MPKAPWTVVTVTYNSASTIQRCWSGLDRPYDWVVVDNNSMDDSVSIAKELKAAVVRLDNNAGFSKANNIGVDSSAGDYILFANPDLEIDPSGLDILQEHLDTFGGIAAPQLVSPDGTSQPNGRGFPYASAKLGNRNFWPLSRLQSSYRLLAQPGQSIWAAWVMGAAVAMRRQDFLRIGGWNERFFLYYEDHEIGLRTWRNGMPVAVLGDVRWVHHWGRATNSFRWSKAHSFELQSARTFFGMFPEFLLGIPSVGRRHPFARHKVGRAVAP